MRTRQGCLLSPHSTSTGKPSQLNNQEKEIKGIETGQDEIKLTLIIDDMIAYVENPTASTKNLIELIDEFSKVSV